MASGTEEMDNSSPRLKNLGNWIHCFCVITFDLEVGQSLELKYPSHAILSKEEILSACYLAFPDSNSGFLGDALFHFRIRRVGGKDEPFSLVHAKYNSMCPFAMEIDPDFFYAFAFFRQVKDSSLPRGYFQKSVVLITSLPFINFYRHILSSLSPAYFSTGLPLIEAVCQEVEHWEDPLPGAMLSLPFMGSVVKLRIPTRTDSSGAKEALLGLHTGGENCFVLPSVHEPELFEYVPRIAKVRLFNFQFSCLSSYLPHLHLLWELVLLGEPIVVMGPFPDVVSAIVQALVNLIWPLRYCYDFRPYFTVQDNDFKEFVLPNGAAAAHNVILGTTNPFFIKALENWPHVLRLPKDSKKKTFKRNSKVRRNLAQMTNEEKIGLFSKYKGFLAKGNSLVKRLAKGVQYNRPSEAQTLIIRRHFTDLTQSFLLPLESPKVPQFELNEFIKTVESVGLPTVAGVKGDWIGLYRAFCETKNFQFWLQRQQLEADIKLRLLHLEAIAEAPLTDTLSTKVEVEVVDFILKLREALKFAVAHTDIVSVELRCRIEEQTNPFETEEIKRWSDRLNQDEANLLKKIIREFELYKYLDSNLPSRLTVKQAERLLILDGKTQRLRYLSYLGRKEHLTESKEKTRLERAKKGEVRRAEVLAERMSNTHLLYALGANCISRRIIDSSMNKIDEARLAFAQMYGQPLVLDMSPMRELSPIETDLTWSQLRECYFVNRTHLVPFDLHFTDCDQSLRTWSDSERYFCGGLDKYMLQWHEQRFYDLFPRERLVYLSPDSRRMLDAVEPDKIYVIGAMVDRPNRLNWTLGKAKQLNITTAKLPLDKYVRWHSGTKSLTLNQVIGILLDVVQSGGDWSSAIVKNVPKRKLIPKNTECSKQIRQGRFDRMRYLLSMVD
ncbi:Family with sequence similarity 116, member B [Trichuris trichiura]|uniref:Family with sequence similarity 116, member B n=1 Tax=Trichuris trichiura TaxID=36087 RepID=A0A077ZFT0_TRITR|nr:Family with sequence similarity 116, member B [Trichuris trichiura]